MAKKRMLMINPISGDTKATLYAPATTQIKQEHGNVVYSGDQLRPSWINSGNFADTGHYVYPIYKIDPSSANGWVKNGDFISIIEETTIDGIQWAHIELPEANKKPDAVDTTDYWMLAFAFDVPITDAQKQAAAVAVPIGKCDKGDIFRIIGESQDYYEIEIPKLYDETATAYGDPTLMTAVVTEEDYIYMYADKLKQKEIGILNWGTVIDILDDSDNRMFKVKGLTRSGNKEGWVDAPALTRVTENEDPPEEEPDPSIPLFYSGDKSYKITEPFSPAMKVYSYEALDDSGGVGNTVQSGTQKRPSWAGGGSASDVGCGVFPTTVIDMSKENGWIKNGTTVTVLESKTVNGEVWRRVDVTNVHHNPSASNTSAYWTPLRVFKKSASSGGNNTTASVNKQDTSLYEKLMAAPSAIANKIKEIFATKDDYTDEDWVSEFASGINNTINSVSQDDKYYWSLSKRYGAALGSPPHYNMDIDPQYMDGVDGQGRVWRKTLLEQPPMLSIVPGKIKMFPYLIGSKRQNVLEAMIAIAAGEESQSLMAKVLSDSDSRFTSKLYEFNADTLTYGNYLNALCRSSAILLGIGDATFGGTGGSVKLKDFDYAYWTIRKEYMPNMIFAEDSDKSIFKKHFSGLFRMPKSQFLEGDNTYAINFYMNGSETSVSETISNEPADSPLSGIFSTLNEVTSSINYFTGSGFNIGADSGEVEEAVKAALGGANSTGAGLVEIGKNFLKGGKMILPKMIADSRYDKSISINLKFSSPYGNRYSVFMRCIVPVMHILAMALPRELSDNMYGLPFLIRANQVGVFNMDVGFISNISVTRGGPDDTAWTHEGLATEWEVNLELTPLVNNLMITSSQNPLLFCKNDQLLDFIGNFCGFDVMANNMSMKSSLLGTMISRKFFDIPHNTQKYFEDKFYALFKNATDLAIS